MEKEPLRPLEDHFCFSVYNTSHAIQRIYQPQLAAHGLTYPQYLVLVILYTQGDSTVKELGAQLNLGTGTTTPLLKRMEKADLVRRQRNPNDERSILIALTEHGEQERIALKNMPDLLTNKASLTDQQWDQLTLLINQLMTDLNQ
ncbi:MarR family winged helix-turn-helix transcriptional regulator [Lactiplantibacillus herbarum]|uniref:MarR family winged helix-turn-helix transcriptional regulator n=1 Tax=Lactiplantibacillus herbarum TaxID=1670446 RepID=UPI00064FE0A6|nr:MarR family transcriptional regulator [Lactiplantibacillus herbarum]